MELASKYNPADVEGKWYQYWLDNKLFSSKPDGREPYTVVIPPPNVTGVLHMGHMLNNTIQDILVRRARMEGKNACWVPGTDHASIATEAKVVNKLAGQGIKKTDLSRDEFLKHAWAWTEEHGGIILKQLRKLGASCDWDRTAFTMDDLTRIENEYDRQTVLWLRERLGEQALNEVVPKALALMPPERRPTVVHQSGRRHLPALQAAYRDAGVDALLQARGDLLLGDLRSWQDKREFGGRFHQNGAAAFVGAGRSSPSGLASRSWTTCR